VQYYTLDTENAICGPFTASQLIEMLEAGCLSAAIPAAAEGDASWRALDELLPTLKADFEREVHAVLQTGPPTSQLMMNLLKEDGDFPRPRKPRRNSQAARTPSSAGRNPHFPYR
jgi:hypothetical protein